MTETTIEGLLSHKNHKLEVAWYGVPPRNATIECINCGCVLYEVEE